MTQYARRTDANHAEFAAFFRACGYAYTDTHRWPGMLDYLVASRAGRLILLEVKAPDDPAPLTRAELATLERYRGAAFVVTSVEQAQEYLIAVDGEV